MDAPAAIGASEQILREHAALRRLAMIVAREPSPAEVFAAVTEETGRVLRAQTTNLIRVANAELAVIVAGWSEGAAHVPVGSTGLLDGRGLVGKILETGRPSRVEDFNEVGGAVAASMRSLGLRSGVAGPVIVGGRIWGALVACSSDPEPPPPGTEDRIAAFAQLISVAIENAETREELAASRARLVAASDEARRRIERDLHDGAQQRLLAAALTLTLAQQQLERGADGAGSLLASAREELDRGLCELRDLARGLHPAVLTDRGVEAAVRALIARTPVPVDLRAAVDGRLDPTIESAAYFVVSEALTNVARYAQASSAEVELELTGDMLVATVADDGIGGADPGRGSGLRGLVDRVQAVGGRLEVSSPPGGGTRLRAELPTQVLGSLAGAAGVPRAVAAQPAPITVDEMLADAQARLRRLTAQEADEAVSRGAVMVDIRDADQRARDGVIPHARPVPRNALEWRVAPSSAQRDPSIARPDAQIVLICDDGCQSSLAAATLQRLGLPLATDVIGGFRAWRAAGLPVRHEQTIAVESVDAT
jgi:signal transduction histidine kinase/rhodanese-related sulfurtransferase